MSDLHHVWRPCQLAEKDTLSTSLACVMLLSALYHWSWYYIWAAPARKDNGHWFSHTSMRTELVNCQGSHFREPMQTDPLSVNVHLLRRMRQLRLAALQGQKKGKCVFLTKTHSSELNLSEHRLDISWDACKQYMQESGRHGSNRLLHHHVCNHTHTHTHMGTHASLFSLNVLFKCELRS